MFESFLLLLTFIALASVFLIWWYQTFSPLFTRLKKIPGPPGTPLVGNISDLFSTPEELFQNDRKRSKEYYPIYKEWLFIYGIVTLLHPDDIELVLSNSKHNDKSISYNFLHSWLGTGLLTSGGAKWQKRRKILTPAFHFNILQEFVPIFNEETQKMVASLKKVCNGDAIDVFKPVTQFTLVSIAETSMGVKLDASPESCEQYKEAIHVFGSSLIHRLLRPWLHIDSIFFTLSKTGRLTRKSIDVLHNFSRNVISEKKKNLGNVKPPKRQAMLDLLLSGRDLDDEGIAEEVDTFMFEGHDTTSLAICYILLLLANHRDIQDEVFEEVRNVLGHPITKPPTYNDLKELAFMERCIKEALRLYPSVPFIARKVSEDVETRSGYVIPKGAMAHIHIFDLHRNPQLYPEPEKYDPDRFLPESTKTRHPFAYLPFSAGPRNCIGQKFAILELKSVLCGILDNFILEPEDKPESVTFITDLVLRCREGIRVRFRVRDTM